MLQLESDLRTAAELGQGLLKRHDDYVAEMDRERQSFLLEIDRQSSFARVVDELEADNRLLEQQNQQTVRENMALLKRLEELNSSLNMADVKNHELRTTLTEAECAVGHLSHRVRRTKDLEAQVLTAELERELLEQDLDKVSQTTKESDARYRAAEQHVEELQRQLELVGSTRLATQDALPPGHQSPPLVDTSSLVARQVEECPVVEVSGTMDDLVSANTSLEDNNAELRRVLASTQDEIALLRGELQRQRQGSDDPEADLRKMRLPRKTVSQELHQHHHYHYHIPTKSGVKKESRTKSHVRTGSKSSLRGVLPPVCDAARIGSKPPDVSTPAKATMSHGLASPPTTNRRYRDSGYFSFASESGRERSISLSQPPSPSAEFDECELSTSTPMRHNHFRSSSHESVFCGLGPSVSTPVAAAPISLLELVQDETANGQVNSPARRPTIFGKTAPVLRHSTSHESVLDPKEPMPSVHAYLDRVGSMRRPYPSPLQNNTSLATVSMSSATAYTPQSRPSLAQTPRGKSYKALRSAAAAQRLSPSATTPPAAPSTNFWRKSSGDKSLPTTTTTTTRKSSSRWISFVPGWSSSSASISAVDGGEVGDSVDPRAAKRPARNDAVNGAGGPVGSVQASLVDETLLREALDL